jgi:hypothetical protein
MHSWKAEKQAAKSTRRQKWGPLEESRDAAHASETRTYSALNTLPSCWLRRARS